MNLYRNKINGDYVFTNNAYKTNQMGDHWLIDGDESFDPHDEIDYDALSNDEKWNVFKSWCVQERLKESNAQSVIKFHQLLEG